MESNLISIFSIVNYDYEQQKKNN